MELRTLTLTALLIATPVLASDTPSSTLAALPRLPTPATLSCDVIQPTVEHIERQTQTVSEQVQILLDQPRRSAGSDVPGEISALLDDQQVTMCVTEFGDYDWLMDLDMQLDADLGALKQDRVRLADACPQKGGFPAADCVARIDAQLAIKAQARTDQYLKQAQAGLDAEAQRMAGCTQRRDAAAERLFQAGGFDLQATGLQVESWKLANVATKRWKGICTHARVALTSMPQG